MFLWLELFLIATGITARLIIPASTCGSGVNLLVVVFIWLALLLHLLNKSKLPVLASSLPTSLKLLLILFGAFIIISFINAPYKFGAFQYLVAWLSDIVLFYLVYSLCSRDPKYVTTLLSVFLSAALVVILYGLYQHLWELRDLAVQIQQNQSLLDVIPADLRGATLARAQAGEPFATFTYQNSFGAFLILIIPLFMVMLYLGRRVMLIITGGLVLILLATGSKGALISLAIPLMFMGYYLPGRFSKHARILLAIVILAVFVVAGIMGYAQMSDSLNVRLGYLDATVKIIRDNPLNGVGLNQFGNSYLYYKSADAGEVLKAHNDYLQIASEMGIPALLVFLAIWFIILKSISRPARPVRNDSSGYNNEQTFAEKSVASISNGARQMTVTDCHSDGPAFSGTRRILPYIFGAGFALFLSEVFQSPLVALDIPLLPTVIAFLLWLVTFRFLYHYLSTGILTTDILRIGLFAGLLAFLIHCLADFNLYVQGLSMSVWFVAAIFLATADIGVIPAMSAIWRKIINVTRIIIVIGVIIVHLVVSKEFFLYETYISMVDKHARDPSIVTFSLRSSWNSYAVEPILKLVWYYHTHVDYVKDSPEPLCQKYLNKAISLNPLAPMLYNQQGRLYLEHAEQERKRGNKKMAGIYEQRAKRAFQMVKELYPTYK